MKSDQVTMPRLRTELEGDGAEGAASANRRQGWTAAGGLAGAVLASSCCIVPLLLVTIGVSGVWIGHLTALEPYKLWFVGAALICLSLGIWQVYIRPKPVCGNGSACARPGSSLIVKSTLWLAAALVAFALTIDWWAPLFY